MKCKRANSKSEFIDRFRKYSSKETLKDFGLLGCYTSYLDFCCPEHTAEEFIKIERECYTEDQ